jgi:hypothetical protein
MKGSVRVSSVELQEGQGFCKFTGVCFNSVSLLTFILGKI